MRFISLCSVLFVALATTVATAQSTAAKRDVVLELTLPNGATPQLRIAEGQTGSVELPDVGKFGFVPTFENGTDRPVVVELFDLRKTPRQSLGRVEAAADGERRQFDTTPRFGVRVVRVVTP
jgi:hypothetical protein